MATKPTGGKEIEFKFRVTDSSAFAALAAAAGTTPRAMVTQVNHFFDTSDFRLNSATHTIRLRDEAGVFTLGSKGPETKSSEGTLTTKSEEEVPVDRDEATAILGGTLSPLAILEQRTGPRAVPLIDSIRQILGGSKLVYVGSFHNERSRLPVSLSTDGNTFDVQFEMDRTIFPGNRVDYEVEVEVKGIDEAVATAAVNAFLAKAHVDGQKASSKAKRFFDIVTAKPRVLVADDAVFMRNQIREILGSKFELVGEATSGRELRDKVSALRPALIILDLKLVDGSSVESIAQIRAIDRDSKIIVYGSLGEEADLLSAIERGASDFLIKPFDARDVEAKVAKVLNRAAPEPVAESTEEPLDLLIAVRRAQTVAADLLKWLGNAQGYRHTHTHQTDVANPYIEDVKDELLTMQRVLGAWPENSGVVAYLEQASEHLPTDVDGAKQLVRTALDTLLEVERRQVRGT